MIRRFGFFALGHAVGRIGEEDDAVLRYAEVVGAVEADAFVVLGRERLKLPVGTEAGDATRAMLTEEHATLGVDGEPVRTLISRRRVGTAGLQKDRSHRIAFDPLVGDVVGHVREDDATFIPDGSFGPRIIPGRDGLDLGAAVQQRIQRGIDLLDGLFGAFGGEGGQHGEEEGGEELHG